MHERLNRIKPYKIHIFLNFLNNFLKKLGHQ